MIGSYTALALAAGPLGLLAFGPLVDAFGPAVGFLLIGIACLLAALLAAISRGLHGLGRPAHGAGEPIGGQPTAGRQLKISAKKLRIAVHDRRSAAAW